ncbi:antibiotic biosynthesis monooxygenase [Aureibaculum sp. A20]|uniref:Antibiotic biosynthesis monooxygenase n=1 Tax=Aureibaculum flavum TaxID=2795986 RepID=A0ABS0WKY9_9FLAO|nr:antibiotic biosynthesis monooxygenase family protein [Aureibaculum flavum]MBJ2172643.1 antibiotic biosynthesis monooxygenase [Aureibaculum flavum]
MLIRIVKLSFEEEKISKFLSTFNAHKEQIKKFKGCTHLELLRDKNNSNIFFTYSYWNNEQDLENYRNSDLFNNVWAQTKVLFNNRPEAWSVERQ